MGDLLSYRSSLLPSCSDTASLQPQQSHTTSSSAASDGGARPGNTRLSRAGAKRAKHKAGEERPLKSQLLWAGNKQHFTGTWCCEHLPQLSPERRARSSFSLEKKRKKITTHLAMPQQSPKPALSPPFPSFYCLPSSLVLAVFPEPGSGRCSPAPKQLRTDVPTAETPTNYSRFS